MEGNASAWGRKLGTPGQVNFSYGNTFSTPRFTHKHPPQVASKGGINRHYIASPARALYMAQLIHCTSYYSSYYSTLASALDHHHCALRQGKNQRTIKIGLSLHLLCLVPSTVPHTTKQMQDTGHSVVAVLPWYTCAF